uniref:Uncharacterized protein n=1 Tax=Rhizophora mucronata TaxID=61149 RepID=A0A2P2NIG6_RHIMU
MLSREEYFTKTLHSSPCFIPFITSDHFKLSLKAFLSLLIYVISLVQQACLKFIKLQQAER